MRSELDRDSKVYMQIAGSIEDDILEGIIREGEPAPSTNNCAEFYNVNPATAAKGINVLTEAGILFKKRGIGMFVVDGARDKILERRRAQFRESFVEPMINEAQRIGMSRQDLLALVMSLHN